LRRGGCSRGTQETGHLPATRSRPGVFKPSLFPGDPRHTRTFRVPLLPPGPGGVDGISLRGTRAANGRTDPDWVQSLKKEFNPDIATGNKETLTPRLVRSLESRCQRTRRSPGAPGIDYKNSQPCSSTRDGGRGRPMAAQLIRGCEKGDSGHWACKSGIEFLICTVFKVFPGVEQPGVSPVFP